MNFTRPFSFPSAKGAERATCGNVRWTALLGPPPSPPPAPMDPFADPISLEALALPVLASDGYTYSLDSITRAARADPWHRSPVTREVLRQTAFPNTLVAQWLRIACPAQPVALWDQGTFRIPAEARVVAFSLPQRTPCVDVALTRARWRLPLDTAVTLTVTVWDTGSRELPVAMHPPPAQDAWKDCEALATAFGVHRVASNPAHISSAVMHWDDTRTGGEVRTTPEDWWVRSDIGTSPEACLSSA